MHLTALAKFLQTAAEAYYTGKPIISDEEFDYLENLIMSEQVGYTPGQKQAHHTKMFSLQKFYDYDKAPSYKEYIETVKLDGAAISLLYFNGSLIQATTRGDGIFGESVLHHIKYVEGLNVSVSTKGFMQVVGEIVAPKSIPNARNYVSGALHLKDPAECENRELTFIAYGVYPYLCSTYHEDMRSLEKYGFYVVTGCNAGQYKPWDTVYPSDGMVFRENNNQDFANHGKTAKYPKGAFALKDASDVVTLPTALLEVTWQVGSSGKVTPVAIFEEIEIDGAKISRATLHNPKFIEDMKLAIGDTILVTRRGGIIPYITGKLHYDS